MKGKSIKLLVPSFKKKKKEIQELQALEGQACISRIKKKKNPTMLWACKTKPYAFLFQNHIFMSWITCFFILLDNLAFFAIFFSDFYWLKN
jgi:hypothetical protein